MGKVIRLNNTTEKELEEFKEELKKAYNLICCTSKARDNEAILTALTLAKKELKKRLKEEN